MELIEKLKKQLSEEYGIHSDQEELNREKVAKTSTRTETILMP